MNADQSQIGFAAQGMAQVLQTGVVVDGSPLERATLAKLIREFADIIESGKMEETHLHAMIAFIHTEQSMLDVRP